MKGRFSNRNGNVFLGLTASLFRLTSAMALVAPVPVSMMGVPNAGTVTESPGQRHAERYHTPLRSWQ